MNAAIIQINSESWQLERTDPTWIAALEAGKVLYFPRLEFQLLPEEGRLLDPGVRDPKARNISLDARDQLKGALDDAATQAALATMIGRFREQSQSLIHSLLPKYQQALRLGPTSYRPMQVETRRQSWRADDRRMHVDAFPSRPNYGEPFEQVAQKILPRAKPYIGWQANALNTLRITKSLRSEYDHLMLQLHDGMKSDLDYQQDAAQITMPFAAGSAWICFSDLVPHAVMSGQYMLEQTLHLPPERQYNPAASPLAILGRLTGRQLV